VAFTNLKVKSAKCLFTSGGLGLGLKNLVLFTSLSIYNIQNKFNLAYMLCSGCRIHAHRLVVPAVAIDILH